MNEESENAEHPEINPILDPKATMIDKIREFGRLKYSRARILAALALSLQEEKKFTIEFDDPASKIRIAYEQGFVLGDVEIDAALAKIAATGDTFSAAELSLRQYYQRVDEQRKELFGL